MNMRALRFLIVLAFGLFAALPAEAQPNGDMTLADSRIAYDASRYIELLEDRDGSLTIDRMADPDVATRFVRNDGRVPSYGYSNSVYWVRLSLRNESEQREWLLNVHQPPMDKIDLYVAREGGGWTHKRSGDAYPFAEREVRDSDYSFYLDLAQEERKTVYLRFETEGAMILPITIETPVVHAESGRTTDLLMGGFFGIMAVMIVYNTILAFSLRSRAYFAYVFINVTAALLYSSLNGIAYQYLWPESVWWNNRSIVFFMCLAHIAALFFTRQFLKLNRQFPTIDRLFQAFILVELINMAVLFASYNAGLRMAACTLVVIDLTIVLVGVASWHRGYLPARFFLTGWGVFMIGTVLTLLADAGIIPQWGHVRYASQIGSLFEAVVLSLGLASRIQSMRIEKERAEALMKETKRQAESDYLTGLYSRRYIVGTFESLQKRPENVPMSMLLLDVDHFKRINDTYGHDTGDTVLRDIANLLRSELRSIGIVGRFGGEEFVALLPGQGLAEAERTAERLLETVRNYPFRIRDARYPCTASAGVAEWRQRERESFESCMRRADGALYEAKRAGRDRVRIARDALDEAMG
ncbi:sensor domain-containing diguanylate cyclase [Paenibacillus flagellatus]|nr:diguanylate cyclase [Paenibacillus flagellatus]